MTAIKVEYFIVVQKVQGGEIHMIVKLFIVHPLGIECQKSLCACHVDDTVLIGARGIGECGSDTFILVETDKHICLWIKFEESVKGSHPEITLSVF